MNMVRVTTMAWSIMTMDFMVAITTMKAGMNMGSMEAVRGMAGDMVAVGMVAADIARSIPLG